MRFTLETPRRVPLGVGPYAKRPIRVGRNHRPARRARFRPRRSCQLRWPGTMPMAGTRSNDRNWTALPAVGSAARGRSAGPAYRVVLMLLVGAAIAVVPHVVE